MLEIFICFRRNEMIRESELILINLNLLQLLQLLNLLIV